MKKLTILLIATFSLSAAHAVGIGVLDQPLPPDHERGHDDAGFSGYYLPFGSCIPATMAQIARVNDGNFLYAEFVNACMAAVNDVQRCTELTRPNPESWGIFTCTYGIFQPHQLIDPDHSTWNNAFQAVRLIKDLQAQGISVAFIYNWWRPEPYNHNIGGAHGRHPFGTSVDVRFSTLQDMERAFKILCKWRKQKKMRALGYYGSTGLHFGIGDQQANTWGKSCN